MSQRSHFELFPRERGLLKRFWEELDFLLPNFLFIPMRGIIVLWKVAEMSIVKWYDTNLPVMNTEVTRTDPALTRHVACMPYILGGFLSIYGD